MDILTDRLKYNTPGSLMKHPVIILVYMCFCLIIPVNAQEGPNAVAIGNSEEPVIEEITVIGARDLKALRLQGIRAQDRFYELFNELNTDDDYDIICRNLAHIGTKIKQRECTPNFYYKTTAYSQQGLLKGYWAPPENMVFDIKYPILEQKMKELILSNEELANRAIKILQLEEEFEDKRKQYLED